MRGTRSPLGNDQLYVPGAHLTLAELDEWVGDPRGGRHLQEQLRAQAKAVRWFLAGGSPFATATDGEYTVHVMADRCVLYVRRDVALPAPAGRWMGFWDEDLLPVTEVQYQQAGLLQQAHWDAQVQLRRYIRDQFATAHADFWCYRAHEIWWWEQGGATLSARDPNGANADWLRRVALVPNPTKEAQ